MSAKTNDGNSDGWDFPFPLSECYFIGKDHEGFAPGHGEILILHVPTRDVWGLRAFRGGSRHLCLFLVYPGDGTADWFNPQLSALIDQASSRCLGLPPRQLDARIEISGRVPVPAGCRLAERG
jgi:hypothetical protein